MQNRSVYRDGGSGETHIDFRIFSYPRLAGLSFSDLFSLLYDRAVFLPMLTVATDRTGFRGWSTSGRAPRTGVGRGTGTITGSTGTFLVSLATVVVAVSRFLFLLTLSYKRASIDNLASMRDYLELPSFMINLADILG